jgi:hypothetical protein
LLRGLLAPLGAPLVPALMRRRRLVAEVVRWVSQLRLGYADSPLSHEGVPRLAGAPRAGQWQTDAPVVVDGRRVRLHGLLARKPGVHVLLHRHAAALEPLMAGRFVTPHRLTSTPGTGVVVVRPDGYVGFRGGVADASEVRAWLARIGAETG